MWSIALGLPFKGRSTDRSRQSTQSGLDRIKLRLVIELKYGPMGVRKSANKVRRLRVGPVPMLSAALVATILVAVMAVFAGRACVPETDRLVAEVAQLEDEIGFRRRALRQALDAAETVQDIPAAQAFLTAQSPTLSKDRKARKLDDLVRDLDRLYAQLDIVLPGAAPVAPVQPDAWLRANYPVDVQGFLYSVSIGELPAARLAAADQEKVFVARRRMPPNSRFQLVPDCSLSSALRHAISGYRRVVISTLPAL